MPASIATQTGRCEAAGLFSERLELRSQLYSY